MSAVKAQADVISRPSLHAVPPLAQRRRTLPNRVAYALAASVIGLGLFASITPSPLYHAYSVLWHFSPLTLTLVYATYAFGVLASLLLVGAASDDVGRRPVLLVALLGLMAATVLFMVANSAAWLFVARGIQGVSTGAALSAASAALLDLHPRRDPTGVGLTNATAATAGIGLGVLVSSTLVRIGWEPRVLPYVLLLVLAAIAFAGAYWMPEPVLERSGFRLTVQLPKVPSVVRRQFVLAGLAVLSSWSIGALFFSLGPQLALRLFHSTDVIVSATGIVALAGSATLAQLLTARTTPWIAASTGSIALAAGMVIIVLAAATDSSAIYRAGSIVGGAGFGAAFLGGLRALVAAIPPEHRAAVMAAFYVAAYASLSVPAVLAGVLVTHNSLESTFEIFGSAVAALALVVALQALRSRPNRHMDEERAWPRDSSPGEFDAIATSTIAANTVDINAIELERSR
ncbi:MAG: MFS transporter [Solirubrobacteraceae bacterium]